MSETLVLVITYLLSFIINTFVITGIFLMYYQFTDFYLPVISIFIINCILQCGGGLAFVLSKSEENYHMIIVLSPVFIIQIILLVLTFVHNFNIVMFLMFLGSSCGCCLVLIITVKYFIKLFRQTK
jgi:hypothetical protein